MIDELFFIKDFFSDISSRNSYIEDEMVFRITNFNNINENDIKKIIQINNLNKKVGEMSFLGNIDGEIAVDNISMEDFDSQEIIFSIAKNYNVSEVIFFTADGYEKYLQKTTSLPKIIRIYDDFQEFSTYNTIITNKANSTIKTNIWNGEKEPRRLLKNLIPDYQLINSLSEWLVTELEALQGNNYQKIFLKESSKKLFLLFANELFLENNNITMEFLYERPVNISLSNVCADFNLTIDDYKMIHAMAEWVFSQKRDVETRHTMLNYQFALELSTFPSKKTENLLSIYENAKKSYKYYLHSKSREMMLSFSELKRNLFIEMAERNKNAYTLIRNLFRDFFIAIGVIMIDNLKINATNVSMKFLSGFTAFFVTIGYIVTLFNELSYQNVVGNNILRWNQKLYPYLEKKDMKNLIYKPLSKIKRNLYITIFVCSILYLILDMILLRDFFKCLNFINGLIY
ncbi:MAG: hypothetical protein LBG15_10565 [Dysgonamonadaceae bacterium]|jgi:hypothetical protein|nr:hypothetical protein [Dysgonamonadaceae bacterium]